MRSTLGKAAAESAWTAKASQQNTEQEVRSEVKEVPVEAPDGSGKGADVPKKRELPPKSKPEVRPRDTEPSGPENRRKETYSRPNMI